MRLKLFLSFVPFLLVGILAVGCTQETASNTDQRERDRQNEKTGLISDEYAKATGTYAGTIASGPVRLEVKTAWTHDPGGSGAAATTPQPILVGFLSIYPDLEISGSQPLEVALAVDSGTYSDETKTMSLVFSGSGSTARLVCDLTDQQNVKCQWYTGARVSTLLLAKTDSSATTTVRQTPGTYSAETPDWDITATFQTTYVSPGTGQGSHAVILGRFVFMDHQSKLRQHGSRVSTTFISEDGTYDPQTDTLSFNIASDSPIVVSCKRVSRADLRCQWKTRSYFEFELKADSPASEED